MRIKITFYLNGILHLGDVMKCVADLKKENPHAEISIEVRV